VTLSEMKGTLARGHILLTKSLGQHFLHDGNQVRRIVAAAELSVTDRVLEIGPGLGPLTELLLETAGTVLAIEKDARLVELLVERIKPRPGDASPPPPPSTTQCPDTEGQPCVPAFVGHPTTLLRSRTGAVLHLVHGDALVCLRQSRRDWSGWKLVANLPYSVASPLLVELAQGPSPPERLVTTLQLEVAQRLMAKAGQADYGQLSLLVQVCYQLASWFKIPPSCFHPPPDVDSACVVLRRRPKPWLEPSQARTFTRLVKRGFSQRRKMMLKLLKAEWPLANLESAFATLGLSGQIRAESVTLEQFVRLAQLLNPPPE
jgi:16S rRNA (adenine1518-N6/adenine1519-N6)-dimethyltransferase